jgi:hypothetical protein
LNTLVVIVSIIVSCEPLQLETPFARVCFGHAMSKACQYATNDVKLCIGMKEVSLKDAQQALQKIMT